MVAAVGAALIVLGWTYLSPLPSQSTPEGAAVRYYRLLAIGRAADADALVSPEYLATRAAANGGHGVSNDSGSLVGLFGVTASAPVTESADALAQDAGYTSGYLDVQDVEVHFVQIFSSDTQMPGPQVWFVTLGRRSLSTPWRILAFGTGG